MVLKSTRKSNSIFDELKERLYIQRLIEIQFAYENYTEDELDETLKNIDDDYDFNLFKLDEISILARQTDEIKRKFIIQKLYIEKLNIPEKAKIENILTVACLLNRHNNLIMDLNENTLYILSLTLLNVGYQGISNFDYEPLIKKQLDIILPIIGNMKDSLEKDKQYIIGKQNRSL